MISLYPSTYREHAWQDEQLQNIVDISQKQSTFPLKFPSTDAVILQVSEVHRNI